jgi:site-specific recombinase XerD
MDIHNFEHKIKRLWERVDEQCSDKNKKILKKFENELYANGLSNARIMIYIEPLLVISKRCKKNLSDLSKDDLKEVVGYIERKKYSEWTKVKYKLAIKKFYSYLDGKGWTSGESSERISWYWNSQFIGWRYS